MRLKSLEIKGFKSFADKTLILLDNPITGIVGPNGCGKSNIVDAIRWVIGEHKIKSLRSDSLEDLIFNGSKTRNAAGMAEVSLTFENTRNILPTEFTTVTVTRKFYKNGESEYRLNDVACRLKDIHNLFLDTGVSNDSYAIIELGMVDDIIKDKDGSRRKMLEQAAGISVYKARKKEAKQKLEGTEQDISRIEDLLFEIANNLRTLESQARKAERYYQIKSEYKNTSIELAKASLADFNDQYQNIQDQLKIEEDKKLKIEAEIAGDEATIESNKVTLIKMEQALNVAQKQFNELQNRIRGLESEKKLATQRLEYLDEKEKGIRTFLKNASIQELSFNENILHIEKTIAELQTQLMDSKSKKEKSQLQLNEKRKSFEEQRKILDAERQQLTELQKTQFAAEKKFALVDNTLSGLQNNQLQILKDKESRNENRQKLKKELEVKKTYQSTQKLEIEALEAKQTTIKQQIQQHQKTLEETKARQVNENRLLDAKKNEYDLLKSLVQSWEGFPESIKFLSQSKTWQGKSPLVSDILTVNEGYKKALETILDTYLNYYVTDNIADAQEAIQLLKDQKKGKANFFILDQLNPKNIAKNHNESLTSALDVINVEQKYLPVAKWLLGQVFIQEDGAPDISDYKDKIIVAKDGSHLWKNAIIGGGSVGVFEGNKIGRVKNLEKLSKAIEQIQSNVALINREVSSIQNLIQDLEKQINEREITDKQQSLHQANLQVNNIEQQLVHLAQQEASDEKRISELLQKMSELESAKAGNKSELGQLIENLTASQQKLDSLQANCNISEKDYQDAQRLSNDLDLEVTKVQSTYNVQRQQKEFRAKQLEDLLVQIENNNQQLKETTTLISETSGKLHFGNNELYDLLEKRDKDEKELAAQDTDYYNFRNEIAGHEKSISHQRREKEQAEKTVLGIKEKLNDMKLKVAGLKERLHVEFQVVLDDILEEDRTTDLNIEALNQEAERLKKKLDNIGEVNPTAIEAYQEMKLRHDFIVEQKTDLEKAKDTLLATIEEVEQTANAKFKATFEQVRENFIHVFKALFTEDDNADLRLTDEDNLAETFIEIYAQPKGKRPSTLTQLSGGEKTLTSTAFLFAIYLIKPAPFCILDEVDAPLDDANVGKFTQMIRKFSDNSQFIIVTHNKQTMASVDVIYGVTMQEIGVSKLVPVDFRSLK